MDVISRGLYGRFHRHTGRVHDLVQGRAHQTRIQHEHHGQMPRARAYDIIERTGTTTSNKMSPSPSRENVCISYYCTIADILRPCPQSG